MIVSAQALVLLGDCPFDAWSPQGGFPLLNM